VLQNMGKMC